MREKSREWACSVEQFMKGVSALRGCGDAGRLDLQGV